MSDIIIKQAQAAKEASRQLSVMSSNVKNNILLSMATALCEKYEIILAENQKDMDEARTRGLSNALLDRLLLTKERIESIADNICQVASLSDPIGNGVMSVKRPNGLDIRSIRVPFGVIGIIYEARPNVTADAIALCIKSGNAVILRGGSEAINSNRIIASILADTAYQHGLPLGSIQFIDRKSRDVVDILLHLRQYIDLIIPRGGAGLIQHVVTNSSVPVIETGVGNCHIYVDDAADQYMATSIIINAKTSRPSVCNAVETILIHRAIAQEYLPSLITALQKHHVEIRGDELVCSIDNTIKPAQSADWDTEYNDLIIAIKVVESIEDAVKHINTHGSGHSEAIITDNYHQALYFQAHVDAATVYVNASTRFSDGNEFGFGAEIGISTQKLHARGPMGLEALTTIKYLVYGDGQIRK